MPFQPGMSGNPKGRVPRDLTEKPTNKQLRQKAFLEMVRKFRPLQAKAIQAAVKILDDDKAQDSNKLKASALLITTYKQLVTELYDYRYDAEEAEEMQKESENNPVFSLKVIENQG